jgi:predicted Ser/Thr protein kinase
MSVEDLGVWSERLIRSVRDHELARQSVPTPLPRYELREELARGGMGVVFRAWDANLARDVAIKFLTVEGPESSQARERFRHEAHLAAKLTHPHIITVHDTGQWKEDGPWKGRDYIAMQLVDGTTLDKANPDRPTLLASIRDAARALHYAHAQGIVHRDIKPRNLMLDRRGHVYVTDFGVAKKVDLDTQLTRPGFTVGTPAYMSPEQADGSNSPRSDVYSLGATLYELILGRPPFAGKDPDEVLRKTRTEEPPSPRAVDPALSKNVEAILLTAMERHPEDRYPSAEELALDLDRYLSGERPLVRPHGFWFRFQRAWVRHPWRSTGSLAFALMLAVLVFLAGWYARAWLAYQSFKREQDPTSRKVLLTRAADWIPEARQELGLIREAELLAATHAREARERLELERSEAQKAEEARKRLQVAKEALAKAEDKEAKRKAIDELATAVQQSIENRRFDEARSHIVELQALAPELFEALSRSLRKAQVQAELEALEASARKGSPKEFGQHYDALRILANPAAPDLNARTSDSVFAFASRLLKEHELREGVAWLDRLELHLGKVDAAVLENRALALIELGEHARAGADFDRLLAHSRPTDPLPPLLAEVPYFRAKGARAARDWTSALRELALTLSINPEHAAALHDRGLVRYRAERLAREALQEDLARALALNPSLSVDAEYTEVALTYVRTQRELFTRREDAKDRATAWREALGVLDLVVAHLNDPMLFQEQAAMALRLGKYTQALETVSRAGEGTEGLAWRARILYGAAIERGRDHELLKEALASLDHVLQVSGPTSIAHFWRGNVHAVLGHPREALEDFEKAAGLGCTSPYMDYQRATIQRELKETARAAELASRALQSVDTFGEEDVLAAHLEAKPLAWSQGIRLFKRDVYLARGQAQFDIHDYPKSIADFSEAIRLDPGFANAHLWLATASCLDRRHKEAQNECREVLRLSTESDEKAKAKQLLERCLRHWKE